MKKMKIMIVYSCFLFLVILGSSSSISAWTSHMQKGLTQWDQSKASDGYVIMANGSLGTVLVDMNGDIVRIWDGYGQEMLAPEMANGEKGHVLVSEGMVKMGSVLQERDWNNNVVWEIDLKQQLQPHHDWQKLPNGNYLILSEINIPEEMVPKTFYGIGIEGEKSVTMSSAMFGDRITEITPSGEIVWDWMGYDHLDLQKVCGYCIDRGDWTHFNAIHYCTNPGYEGKIVASNRHHNEIIMIDQKTGDIVWRWGEDVLGHQHDAQMIDPGLPGEGHILVFDNGHHSDAGSSNSSVLEVDPKTNQIVWSYKPGQNLRSWHISGCQRLENGNTLITEGENGRIFEVTTQGEIVWEYNNPISGGMVMGGQGREGMPGGMQAGEGGARGGMPQGGMQAGDAGARGGGTPQGGMQAEGAGARGSGTPQGGMQAGGAGARGGGMPQGGMQGGGGGDTSVFKARKVPASWVPDSVELSPELLEAAALRSKAKSAYDEAETLSEKANQVIKNIK